MKSIKIFIGIGLLFFCCMAMSAQEKEADSLRTLGLASEEANDLTSALKFYKASFEKWDLTENKAKKALLCHDIAVISGCNSAFIDQNHWAEKGIALLKESPENGLLCDLYIEAGNARKDGGNYKRSAFYFKNALACYQNNKNTFGKGDAQYGMGQLLYTSGSYIRADSFARNAIAIFDKEEDSKSLAQTYNLLGAITLESDTLKAKEYFEKSLALAETEEDSSLMSDAHHNLGLIASYLDDAPGIKFHYQKVKKIGQAPNQFILEELEGKMALINTLDLRMRNRTISLISILLLILLITYILNYRKKIHRQQLEEQQRVKREKEELQKELAAKQRIEEASQKAKELGEKIGRKELRDYVHNHIGSQLAATIWSLDACSDALKGKQLKPDHLDQVQKMIRKAQKASSNIENQLLNNERNWLEAIRNFFKFLPEVSEDQAKVSFYSRGVDESILAASGKKLYQIICNGMANALLHSEATNIHCQLNRNQDEIILIIEDNGKGFDPGIPRDSLGLTNIKKLVNALNGKVRIDSSPKYGTTIAASIPIGY